MFKNFKNFIQNEIVNVVAWRLARSVEDSLNQVLIHSNSGEIGDIKSGSSITNYWKVNLLQDPIFYPTYVSFVLDGTFRAINDQKK